jgi:hypothetical protein
MRNVVDRDTCSRGHSKDVGQDCPWCDLPDTGTTSADAAEWRAGQDEED